MFRGDIEKITIENKNYRRVLHTTPQQQLVVMSIPPLSDIHKEKHPNTTQLIRIEKGNGIAIVNGKRKNLSDGVLIIIPPNTTHYIKNTSKTEPLQLYSVYSPPEHPKKLTQRNKPEND